MKLTKIEPKYLKKHNPRVGLITLATDFRIEKDFNNVNVPEEMIWNQQFIDLIELKNMITTAKAVAIASLKREKSVGGHVRLDKETSSLFSKPYSTLVKINKNNTFEVCKLLRQKTPLKRIINYKISEKFRFMKAKILRILPESISDKIIENIKILFLNIKIGLD